MTLQCKIPRDRSALGMMVHNAMNHGDDFRNDGYVYDAEGIRIRKWFSGLGDHSRKASSSFEGWSCYRRLHWNGKHSDRGLRLQRPRSVSASLRTQTSLSAISQNEKH